MTLAEKYQGYFPIGVAINPMVLPMCGDLIKTEFSSVTAENEMKFMSVHPEPDKYDFTRGDEVADFAVGNNMKVRGHTLIWHNQTGRWMFKDAEGNNVAKEVLYERMEEHINKVLAHYAGKAYCWDVVNEAIDDSEGFLRTKSPYYAIVESQEFIDKAFTLARKADPNILLFYNDYNTETPGKRDRIIKLLKNMKENGTPIDGMGLQAHYDINFNTDELKRSIEMYSALGLQLHITELDVSVYAWNERELKFDAPPADRIEKQTKLYADIFEILRANKDVVTSVTFWGINDRVSWLNGFPVRRRNFPLLFDDNNQKKPAYDAIMNF